MLVADVVVTVGNDAELPPEELSFKQRTEMPNSRMWSPRKTPLPLAFSKRNQASHHETEEDHQYPWALMAMLKTPSCPRKPPGRAVKPEVFVAPEFVVSQPPRVGCVAVLFKAPPAMLLCQQIPHTVSALGSRYFTKIFHSPSEGTCQPVGHKPLLSVTA
jgi:hypothetical protein